jgi:hypothetical protein
MRKRSSVALTTMLGIALAALLGAPAEGGDPSDRTELSVARGAGAPYDLEGFQLNLNEGEKRNVLLKVQSLSGASEEVTLRQAPIYPPGITAKYLRSDRDITAEVLGAGFNFTVQPEKAKKFRARFKRPNGAPGEGCANINASQQDGGFSSVLVTFNQPQGACVI